MNSSIYPFERKRQQSIKDYDFIVRDNPRTSDGGLGSMECHICESRSSVLLAVYLKNSHDLKQLVICKGCLNKMDELLNWGILEQTKERK